MSVGKRELDYKKLILDSGAILYILRMPWVKTVGLGVHINAGSRDEVWPKQAGIAHAMEHMVFQGTQEFPDSKSLAEYIEVVGGMLNAYTCSETTFFYNCLPAEEKERGLRVLSQKMRQPLLRQDKIDVEMKNILQEINRANDDPCTLVNEKAEELLYGDHPLAKRTLGTKESVFSFKRSDFLDWYKTFYHSSNFTFLAVGGINSVEIKELFNRYFPEKSSLPANKREHQSVLRIPAGLTIEKEVEQAHVILGTTVPGASERDSRVLKVFRTMLDGGMSFPLFQEIRDKRGLCYEISASSCSWSDAGIFQIYLGTDPKRIREAEKAIHEIICQTKTSSLLLETAKQLVRGSLAFAFETPRQLIYSASMELTRYGKPRGYKERLKEVESVTIEEVEGVVNRYLAPEKIVKVALLPKSAR